MAHPLLRLTRVFLTHEMIANSDDEGGDEMAHPLLRLTHVCLTHEIITKNDNERGSARVMRWHTLSRTSHLCASNTR